MTAPFISLILETLYPEPEIPLTHTNAFSLLIAVLLSAQCTDIKVNKVTPYLFSEGDTPEALLKRGYETIEAIIKPLGLYRTKAANIISLSQRLIDVYQGQVPSTIEALTTLAGVGHKTASCVIAQIFKQPAFPVDTHIHRLAKRWGLSSGKNVEKTESDLKLFFRKEDWNQRHLQMIYYARSYCPAKGHKLDKCPICLAISVSV